MNEATRRDFLSRLAKAGLFLPVLESVSKLSAQGKIIKRTKSPMKLVCINLDLGFSDIHENFTPRSEGYTYAPSKILKGLRSSRVPHTVVSYATHNIHRGHQSSDSVWTAHNSRPNKYIGQRISLDQVVAESYRGQTYKNYVNFLSTIRVSYTKKGVGLGSYNSPQAAFNNIFRPFDKKNSEKNYQEEKLLVDVFNKKVKTFKKGLNKRDSDRIGDYMEALSDIERLEKEKYDWGQNFELPKKPKLPIPDSYMGKYKSKFHSMKAACLESIRLFFQADITRVASLSVKDTRVDLPGLTESWHTYTHHGGRGDKRDPVLRIDKMNMSVITDFVVNLNKTKDEFGASLLDSTIVLVASGLGNANHHSATTLPFIAIGGSLKHKGHVSFKNKFKAGKKTYLANTYVELLQYMGLEVEKFGNSNGISNIWS